MRVLYDDKSLVIDNDCNTEKILYVQGGNKENKIYIANIKNKIIIIKQKKHKNDKEYKYLERIYKDKSFPFFCKIRKVVNCDKYNFYFMDNIDINTELRHLIMYFNKEKQMEILNQCLLALHHLKHECGLYHNDIFAKDKIRNILLDYNISDTKYGTHIIKIIDFEYCSAQPKFRTIEYHNKYFSKVKYVSEILIFIYVFFLNIDINVYPKLLNYALKLNEKDQQSFDEKLIAYVETTDIIASK